MPTENRFSNTEMVSVPPYIGLEPLVGLYYPAQCRSCGWVGSSEELTEDDAQCTRDVGDRLCLGDCDELDRDDLLGIIQAMAQPAPQPHPDPIAWMVGTAFWWNKEEAERDAAATGLPIVGLGPMTGIASAEQSQSEPLPITNYMGRLMEACRIGEFKDEGGSETIEALAVESLDAKSSMGHDADSYMAGYTAALYEQAEPFIWLSLNSHRRREPETPGNKCAPLEAVRASDIQDLLDRAATAIGQYGDSLLGRGQREDSVDLLDLEREVRDLEQEFRGAFALPGA